MWLLYTNVSEPEVHITVTLFSMLLRFLCDFMCTVYAEKDVNMDVYRAVRPLHSYWPRAENNAGPLVLLNGDNLLCDWIITIIIDITEVLTRVSRRQENGSIPRRIEKSAHEVILDFIRSRPPLNSVGQTHD